MPSFNQLTAKESNSTPIIKPFSSNLNNNLANVSNINISPIANNKNTKSSNNISTNIISSPSTNAGSLRIDKNIISNNFKAKTNPPANIFKKPMNGKLKL